MTESPRDFLSPQGIARREAMLTDLTETLRRTHRARKIRRKVLNVAVLALGALVLVRMGLLETAQDRREPTLAQQPARAPRGIDAGAASTSLRCTIVRIESDPDIVGRLSARPSGGPTLIDDYALVAVLAELDRPAGIIRSGGRARLTAAVTDEERKLLR